VWKKEGRAERQKTRKKDRKSTCFAWDISHVAAVCYAITEQRWLVFSLVLKTRQVETGRTALKQQVVPLWS
jgi:hypothetical protein